MRPAAHTSTGHTHLGMVMDYSLDQVMTEAYQLWHAAPLTIMAMLK
jgi:hypothetical protein